MREVETLFPLVHGNLGGWLFFFQHRSSLVVLPIKKEKGNQSENKEMKNG